MITFFTLLHGLVAIALLGAITHQGLTVWRKPGPADLFINRFRAIPAARFANSICVLYIITFALGAYIYPRYVLDVKASIADYGMHTTVGLFQMKEHMGVVGLALLPVYWHFWRSVPPTAGVGTRRFLTTFLMLGVWWNLIIGHILNNLKGLI